MLGCYNPSQLLPKISKIRPKLISEIFRKNCLKKGRSLSRTTPHQLFELDVIEYHINDILSKFHEKIRKTWGETIDAKFDEKVFFFVFYKTFNKNVSVHVLQRSLRVYDVTKVVTS